MRKDFSLTKTEESLLVIEDAADSLGREASGVAEIVLGYAASFQLFPDIVSDGPALRRCILHNHSFPSSKSTTRIPPGSV
jgi:hypothetical protein